MQDSGWGVTLSLLGHAGAPGPKDRDGVGGEWGWGLLSLLGSEASEALGRRGTARSGSFPVGLPGPAVAGGLTHPPAWTVPQGVSSPQLLPGAVGQASPDQPRSGPSRPWLSPCFRAWWRWVQRRRAAAALVARGRRQLLHRGLWALRGALRLREAQLEAAWGRHTWALLAQSFRKVSGLQVVVWGGDERLVRVGRRFPGHLSSTSRVVHGHPHT